MRSTVSIIALGLSAGIAVVFAAKTMLVHEQDFGGGFKRTFRNEIIRQAKSIDIKYSSYYLAGLNDDRIFLGHAVSPNHVLSISSDLSDTTFLALQFPKNEKFLAGALHITVRPPEVFALETITPAFLKGKFDDLTMNTLTVQDSATIGTSVVISGSSFVTKGYDNHKDISLLRKVSVDPANSITRSNVLERQGEGLFSMEGHLLYEPRTASIVYVYYYRNAFIRLDSSLNLLYKARTIDTVSRVKLHVETITSEKTRTLAAPPVYVNRRACIFNDRIFIWSQIRSDEEEPAAFNLSIVIDTYALSTGRYLFSFLLPHDPGSKLSSFSVYDEAIYSVQGHFLVVYAVRWPDLFN